MATALYFLLSTLLFIACGYSLFTLYAAWRFFQQGATVSNSFPPVSIFKPLKGAPSDLYDNLASFCRLDYPEFQVLCGVRDPDDPAVAIVERLQRDFPTMEIQLVVKPEQMGSNAKVSTLHRLAQEAKYDIFVISDGDVRVEPDYLRRIVPPLCESNVGVVTCLYRGRARSPLPSLLESLIINSTFSPQVIVASQVEATTYAFGATIGITRTCLASIGGFAAIADYLADDYFLGYLATQAGYRAVIVPCVVETNPGVATMQELFHHQVRWARTQRNRRPGGYFGTVITYGTVWSFVGFLVFCSSPFICALSITTVTLRVLSVGIVGGRYLRSVLTRTFLWLIPVIDLFSFLIWCVSVRGSSVRWGNGVFRVYPDGTMERIDDVSSAT
ncbi:MAG: bacteriohopanetetrol glucosamine biosynthesis glycosyltransferase HpnI [Candidatus Binatia bacterium]